jgi:hypothetical protein
VDLQQMAERIAAGKTTNLYSKTTDDDAVSS